MSPSATPSAGKSVTPSVENTPAISWPDPDIEAAFQRWFMDVQAELDLDGSSLRPAWTNASFGPCFRVDHSDGSRIVMAASPPREDFHVFERVARLMADAGLNVPRILARDTTHGFMLLSDLGHQTMMQALVPEQSHANLAIYLRAVDALITWQLASKPEMLPSRDEALFSGELELFPRCYLTQYRATTPDVQQRRMLEQTFQTIVRENLSWPCVYVHGDLQPRNLVLPEQGETRLGVLGFQHAFYGPITYDIASLLRDAFMSWDEEFVLDVTIRYWEKARAAGLPVGQDFGAFYRGVEWMGLQRHLRQAGDFARQGLSNGKTEHLADTPRLIEYIRGTSARYRELKPLLRLIDKAEGVQDVAAYVFGRT